MKTLSIFLITFLLLPTGTFADKQLSQSGLTKQAMLQRSEIISQVKYVLDIDLVSSEQKYNGAVSSSFMLSKVPESLRIDFSRGQVNKVLVNSKLTDDYIYNDHFILLPGKNLVKGKNDIRISFSHDYAKDARGFYRFKDPRDNLSYVYTHFEPYDANRLFPQFDQPDLKATFKLTVIAPANWTVISSVREQSVDRQLSAKTWYFPESKLYSTYLFNLIAGPFSVWESSYQGEKELIPLRLFSRQSLSDKVNHEEWFKITSQGFNFFEQYFDTAYPFAKYDQILVPDFEYGAMENVAAVTFNEMFVYKSTPTKNQREGRADTILHELAHMWFGNLVTMSWWNGLWLNESFATLMAAMALFEATEFTDSWQSFYDSYKNWAYWSDQLVTTHPIEVPVNNTTTAFTNFDGITYGKGASALKQLLFYLGDDFRDGLRHYFKMHAWSNTELEDFFSAMQAVSGKDLGEWNNVWIKKAGLNTLAVDFSCTAGVISKFYLIQTAPKEHAFLRPHRTKVALLSRKNNKGSLKVYKTTNAFYESKKTRVKEFIGIACPELVFANYDDQDYVKLLLDEQSLTTVKTAINDIDNTLLRTMVWKSLWDMVRDGNWPITQYLGLVLNNVATEKDYKIKSKLLRRISEDVVHYLIKDRRNRVKNSQQLYKIEEFLWENLILSKSGSDQQKDWYEAYRRSASSEKALTRLADLLDGNISLTDLEIDQKRRWDILKVLNEFGFPGAWKRVEIELKTDKSHYAKKAAIAAEVRQPDPDIKKKWMQKIMDFESELKFTYLKTAMKNIFPESQSDLQKVYVESYFETLTKLAEAKDNNFMSAFTRNLAPAFCTADSGMTISRFLDSHADLAKPILKNLRIENQENGRCVKIIQQITY